MCENPVRRIVWKCCFSLDTFRQIVRCFFARTIRTRELKQNEHTRRPTDGTKQINVYFIRKIQSTTKNKCILIILLTNTLQNISVRNIIQVFLFLRFENHFQCLVVCWTVTVARLQLSKLMRAPVLWSTPNAGPWTSFDWPAYLWILLKIGPHQAPSHPLYPCRMEVRSILSHWIAVRVTIERHYTFGDN